MKATILATAGLDWSGMPYVLLVGMLLFAITPAVWCVLKKSRIAGVVAIGIVMF